MPITIAVPNCPICGLEDDPASIVPLGTTDVILTDPHAQCEHVRGGIRDAFAYLVSVDQRFSPFIPESEVNAMRRGEVHPGEESEDMRCVLELCRDTATLTRGCFDAWARGFFDPSGLVKGWSLRNTARILERHGLTTFAIDGAGDIEVRGAPPGFTTWRTGIRNPFDPETVIKVLDLRDCGIATSANYIRGAHIVDPRTGMAADSIASMTVIAHDVLEADRLATAAFVMGREGMEFLASIEGVEGYMVDHDRLATYTTGFRRFIAA